MNFFDEASLRLKQQLAVTHDRDVAMTLGMSPRAWAGRKKSEIFPAQELYALVAQRPELGIDAQYVLTGQRTEPQTKTALDLLGKVASEMGGAVAAQYQKDISRMVEQRLARQARYDQLLGLLDGCPDEDLDAILLIARRCGQASKI